jgi:nucleoside 2-deoxyribosyltransferase
MKYYFTGSTKHLDEDSQRYAAALKELDSQGFEALNYVHFPVDNPTRKKYEKQLAKKELSVYQLQTSLIDQSDFLIADVSRESITVGYQIDYAIRKKIPVLVLVNKKNEQTIPVMLTNNHFGMLTVEKYSSDEDIKNILKNFTKSVISDRIKFNFFINIPIHNYLTKRAAKENKNKSEILRELILEEIKRKPY